MGIIYTNPELGDPHWSPLEVFTRTWTTETVSPVDTVDQCTWKDVELTKEQGQIIRDDIDETLDKKQAV